MQELLFVQAKSAMAPWAFYTHRVGIIVSSGEMRESLCERHVLTWMLSTLESSATCSHCLLDRVSLGSPSCLGTNCRRSWPQKSEVHSISLEFRLKACALMLGSALLKHSPRPTYLGLGGLGQLTFKKMSYRHTYKPV